MPRRPAKREPVLLGRWYRAKSTDPDRPGEVRSPYRFDEYDDDSGRPKIVYRGRKVSSGCSVSAWYRWVKKFGAELMPEGWMPEGIDGWTPKDGQ